MNDFLTIKEVASLYKVSERTLKRHIHKVTNGVTKYVKHNGRIVVKKEANKWHVMRSYVNQFYDLRTAVKSDKESDTSMPKHDMTYDTSQDLLIKELRDKIEYLTKEIELKNKTIERLENRFDDKENDSRVLLSKLVEMQSKMIEAPKKRRGWFR